MKKDADAKDALLIKYLVQLTVIFFIVSIVFDLAISITIFKYDAEFFYNHEFNRNLVDDLNNKNYVFSVFVWGNAVILLILLLFYKLYLKSHHIVSAIILDFIIIGVNIISALHIFGGFSWWTVILN